MLLPQSFQICGCVYCLLFHLLSVLGLHYCMGFSLVAAIGGYSSCGAHASHCRGFSCCGARALERSGVSTCSAWAQRLLIPGCRAQAQELLSCSAVCGIVPGRG